MDTHREEEGRGMDTRREEEGRKLDTHREVEKWSELRYNSTV